MIHQTPSDNMELCFLSRTFCCLVNTSSPTWTTSSSCACQIAWVPHQQTSAGGIGTVCPHSGSLGEDTGLESRLSFSTCCQEMQETAARLDPQARVWRGEGLLTQQWSRVLGIPSGPEERTFGRPQRNTELCSSGFRLVRDLQSTWLLLFFCANTRATFSLRGLPPAETEQFAALGHL